MKKKVDVRGVPARRASRSRASGVADRSVAKKRPSPPARSRKWYDTDKWLPAPRGTSRDSDYVLCIPDMGPPVTCWYSHIPKTWIVADHRSNNDPVKVLKWMRLPEGAPGYGEPLQRVPALGIEAAPKAAPERSEERNRRRARPAKRGTPK